MFYERPNLLFLACRLSFDSLLNEQKMLVFSFCILEENDLDVVNRGFLVYLNHKNTVFWNIRVRSKFSHLEYSVLLLEMRSYTYHEYLGKFIHRRRRESFRFQRRAEIKPRFILPEKKFCQPWLLLTVQYLVCILAVAIFAWSCVRVRPKNFLSLSLFFFFIVPRWRLGQDRMRKMKKPVHFIG